MRTQYVIFGLVCLFTILIYVYYVRNSDPCRVLRIIRTDYGIVEIVPSGCQEGLPHTTQNGRIRMTEDAYSSTRIESTLLHESVHLDQRMYPEKWNTFYEKMWNYTISYTAPDSIPYSDIKQLRPNPDTSVAPYSIWNSRYVFFPIFGDDGKLASAPVKVWDLYDKKFTDIPTEWKEFFCTKDFCPYQYEHPHEISAEYITKGIKTPASQKLFLWRNEKNIQNN